VGPAFLLCAAISTVMVGLFFCSARRPLAALSNGLSIFVSLQVVAALI
jgi:hypothetical protein